MSALAEDDVDEEAQSARRRPLRFDEEEYDSDALEDTDALVGGGAPRTREDSFMAQSQWDEEYDAARPSAWQQRRRREHLSQRIAQEPRTGDIEAVQTSSEQTPLLKKVSFSILPSPRRYSEVPAPDTINLVPAMSGAAQQPATGVLSRRRFSSGSAVSSATVVPRGQSTFGQTVRRFYLFMHGAASGIESSRAM